MKFVITTAALALVATVYGHAESPTGEGSYAGVSLETTTYLSDAQDKNEQKAREADRGNPIHGGYRLLRYFALEGLISDLGGYKLGNGRDLVNTEFAAFTGNAVGILPFGDSGFELYGRMGAGMVSRQSDPSFPVPEDNENSTVSTLGLGLRFSPVHWDAVTLTAGYDTYMFQVADSYSDSSYDRKVSLAKLGLQYQF